MFELVATVRATTEDAASADDAAQESVSQPVTFTRVGNMDCAATIVERAPGRLACATRPCASRGKRKKTAERHLWCSTDSQFYDRSALSCGHSIATCLVEVRGMNRSPTNARQRSPDDQRVDPVEVTSVHQRAGRRLRVRDELRQLMREPGREPQSTRCIPTYSEVLRQPVVHSNAAHAVRLILRNQRLATSLQRVA
ncbi:hypothetical protein HPB52_009410 [Rhipicephalus sanguineus]|uniref:Uncharacterized protein n=1 Tax=Rhipicephalus sanguineus TaxID=34632 RepID=A0A9D4PSB2_RHISA|nr:hypothetical protein HPB52_009410 [Rhipicephalus sanguineus]